MALLNLRAHCQYSHREGRSSPSRHSWCIHWVTPQKHMKQKHRNSPWGGVHRGSFSGWSTLVLPIWHWSLEPDLKQIGPGRGLSQRQPKYQQQHNHLDSCSYSTLAPSTSPLHTTYHSLAIDLGWTPWRKGHDHGLFLGRTTNDCTGVHTVTIWSSLASRAHFLWDRARATVPYWAWDSGLLLKQRGGGRRSSPWQGCDSQEEKRRPHSTSRAGSGHNNSNHISLSRVNSQHILRRDVAGIQTRNSPHTKNIELTQSTQGFDSSLCMCFIAFDS